MKTILLVITLILSGCGVHNSTKQMGEEIVACKAIGLDFYIGDWSQVLCVKPKPIATPCPKE